MRDQKQPRNYFWKVTVAILMVVVIAQFIITYQGNKENGAAAEVANKTEEKSVQLVPRSINARSSNTQNQTPILQKKQQIMRPLPNLSRNQNIQLGTKLAPKQQQTASQNISPNMMINTGNNNNDAGMAQMQGLMNAMLANMNTNASFPSMSQQGLSRSKPPVISIDKNQNYVVQLEIPGLDKDEIQARVSGNILTVSGVQKEESTNSGQGSYSYISSSSSFQNSFALPGAAKSEGIKLHYDGDTLTIRIPQA